MTDRPTASITGRALRILGALALMAGGVLFIAPPASAAPVIIFVDCPNATPRPSSSPNPSPTPTPVPCTPDEGDGLRGTVNLGFSVDSGSSLARLSRVELFILATEDGIPSPGDPDPGDPVKVWEFPDGPSQPRQRSLNHVWDTNDLTPHNGFYDVKVRAFNHPPDASQATATRADLAVDNVPATPEAPDVVIATQKGVRLKWSEAEEVDALHYRLHWARTSSPDDVPESGDFDDSVQVDDTEYVHLTDESGTYWYKLQAFRRSVVASSGAVGSALSARSSAGVVPEPTPSPDPSANPSSPSPAFPPAGGGGSSGGTARRVSFPPLSLPRTTRSAPAVPDAPFSALLPYDLPEEAEGDFELGAEGELSEGEFGDIEDRVPGPLPAIAIGSFLVSAALALGRMPT